MVYWAKCQTWASEQQRPPSVRLDGQRPPDGCNGNSLKNSNKAAADAKMYAQSGSEKQVSCPSAERIRELANDCLTAAVVELEETGDADLAVAGLERRLRKNLTAAGVSPESVEVELGRIMDALVRR
jgi:hypothetical protein